MNLLVSIFYVSWLYGIRRSVITKLLAKWIYFEAKRSKVFKGKKNVTSPCEDAKIRVCPVPLKQPQI